MKAVVFDQVGDPEQVLYLADLPVPRISKNEVLVKMVAASINPGDFLFIRNLYPDPKKPAFPAQVGGNHGAGIIVETGPDSSLAPGALVAFSYYNTWAEYATVPEEWLIPLPDLLAPEKAGQLVNAITAYDLVEMSGVRETDWLVITAGNAAVSTMAAQFASAKGINVITFVRSRNPAIPLEKMGCAAVIELTAFDGDTRKIIGEITGGQGISGVIDNVGGPLTAALIRSLNFGGKVIINGGMSDENYNLHNFDILLNGVQITPYVYRYFFAPPARGDKAYLDKMLAVYSRKDFIVPVAGLHALSGFRKAVHSTLYQSGGGKHLFSFT
ncbi:quinone oxidoreductase family protein [Chitinophaga japonensis]|uniref:Trans-2-enoyl-CoA reductase n=1 Tax=Chitinophaga japonensis TaxID=104662 RepID=A0A562SSS0_CHIJA|nr:zinc-binding dehydrogenase [Chitinophaga japonensis]TWI84064.1 trans-2-enoyl-CoA reductase [Chitinophaga japonensis]